IAPGPSAWRESDPGAPPLRSSRSFLQVQPDEAGHVLVHERGALVVKPAVLLAGLGLGLLIAVGRLHRRRRLLDGVLPGREFLPEPLLADALHRRDQSDAVPYEEVELTVAVHVVDPDPARVRGALEVGLGDGLAVLDLG